MTGYTQRSIMKTFMDLLKERPYDKVTVVDVTRKCGVNRNTFYYHFHDLNNLLDQIFSREEDRILAISSDNYASWEDSFSEGIRWIVENKVAIRNIYDSSGRDRLTAFLFRAGRTSARRFVSAQVGDLRLSQQDYDDVVHVFGVTITGLVIEWISSDMNDDPRMFVLRAAKAMRGSVRAVLEHIASR